MNKMAKRASRLPIVGIVAVLLGGAVAFFCFAMPVGLVERLVVESGLPAVLPAAAPPLGMKAQALFAGAVGIATMLAVILGFAAAGGSRPVPRRAPIMPEAAEKPRRPADFLKDAPRQRRADAHPDAPARRPIFAGEELGEPLDLAQPLPDDGFADATAPAVPHSWQPAPRPYESDTRAEEEALAAPIVLPAESYNVSDAAEPAIEAVTEQRIYMPSAEPESFEDAIFVEHAESAIESPPPAEEAVPDTAPEAPRADAVAETPSVTELLGRLEAGLIRREAAATSVVRPLRAPPPTPPEDMAEDKLRAALDELQRMAGRRG